MRRYRTGMFTLLAAMILGAMVAHGEDSMENKHLAINNPAEITTEEAEATYDALKEKLAGGYAASHIDIIKNYQSWRRYNSGPYLSATHGQRFVNSYANDAGSAYGALKDGERYPKGTVFAKDSITITGDGKSFVGALFVMEKLERDSSPASADWRYLMVLPDGSLLGDTSGDEPELVEYCHACHQAKAKDDYVFFVPEEVLAKK